MISLVNTLFLAGAALAVPTGLSARQEEQTCHEKSTKVSDWTVDEFDYHASYIFTNPAHQNSWGYVNFTLSNPALDYKPICSASSSQLSDFFYGTFVYQCQLPEGAEESTFTFSRPSGELRINQTWSCPDEGSRFKAEGGIKLDLECEDTTWENPDWELGQIYSSRTVTCEPVTVDAPIETMSAVL